MSAAPTAEFDIDHIDEDAWKRLADKMTTSQGDLTKPDLYDKLRDRPRPTRKRPTAPAATSSSISPSPTASSAPVVEQLGKAKLTDQDEEQNGKPRFWRRVVIEKPFGHSLQIRRGR